MKMLQNIFQHSSSSHSSFSDNQPWLFFKFQEANFQTLHINSKQDANYLDATIQENKLHEQYKQLDLSDEQRKIIMQWTDAIQAQESAYTAVVFRMSMQFCFSLLMQLADL